MWNSISNWFKELAYEEYELTVWFKDKEEIIDGRKIHPRTKKVFRLKNVSKDSLYYSVINRCKNEPLDDLYEATFWVYINKL